MAVLEQDKVASRKEVPFKIDLAEIVKSYKDIFYNRPMDGYQWLARKVEGWTKSWTWGYASLLSLPAALIVRTGARVAHEASRDGDYSFPSHGVGVVSAAAAAWLVGKMVYGAMMASTSLPVIWGGSIGAGVVAALPAVLVVVPAFAAGTMLGSTAVGSLGSALSLLVGVPKNIGVAWRRTCDRFSIGKYDEETLKELYSEFDEDSLQTQFVHQWENNVARELYNLPDESRERIYLSLKQQFPDAAEAPEQAASATPSEEDDPSSDKDSSPGVIRLG